MTSEKAEQIQMLRQIILLISLHCLRTLCNGRLSQKHNIGNNDIYANFVLSYICSFLLHLYKMALPNVKVNISGFFRYVF